VLALFTVSVFIVFLVFPCTPRGLLNLAVYISTDYQLFSSLYFTLVSLLPFQMSVDVLQCLIDPKSSRDNYLLFNNCDEQCFSANIFCVSFAKWVELICLKDVLKSFNSVVDLRNIGMNEKEPALSCLRNWAAKISLIFNLLKNNSIS
jgi:hypothetical protein